MERSQAERGPGSPGTEVGAASLAIGQNQHTSHAIGWTGVTNMGQGSIIIR